MPRKQADSGSLDVDYSLTHILFPNIHSAVRHYAHFLQEKLSTQHVQ